MGQGWAGSTERGGVVWHRWGVAAPVECHLPNPFVARERVCAERAFGPCITTQYITTQ